MEEETRKLAAIMFTDMVGYSAITQKNEHLALELLEEHRQILRSFFPKHAGYEVETAGDAFFVEFVSALEAVQCAIEIQRALYERNKSVSSDKQINIRIGVHLGDVVHRGKNVLGDGVNIAARIEPLAQSCGICVSQDVARQIQNKIDLPIVKIDKTKLKNIELHVDIYAVILPWLKDEQIAKKIFVKIKKPYLIAFSIFTLVCIFFFLWFLQTTDNEYPEKKSIAVLPFRNMSEKIENEYFSDGITEDIIARLSKLKNLKVVSRTSVMQYKNTKKNLKDIGDELNVAAILEGSVRCDNQKIRIVAQLIDADEDEHLWTATYDEQLTEIFDIQTSVAEKIAASLNTTFTSVDKQLFGKRVTKSLVAYDLYLKGRYHWNKRMPDDLKKSIEYFEKALKIDPQFALAYSGLADSYTILGNFGVLSPEEAFTKGKKAAHNALKINDMLAEAHTSLALAQMHYDWNWQDAEIGFQMAIKLDPSYAMAYSLYASYLTILRRSDEAKIFREKARGLDPICPAILLNESLELYFEKKYDQTITHCQKLLELDPFLILAYIPLSGAYVEKSMYDIAIEKLINAQFLSNGHSTIMAVTGYVQAVSGKKDEARNLLEILLEKSQEEYVGPFWIAVLYAGLGEHDQTLTWLEKSFKHRDGILVYLGIIPIFEHLHSNPRFKNILTQMGLRS